jgi:hypothetical protein
MYSWSAVFNSAISADHDHDHDHDHAYMVPDMVPGRDYER